MVFAIHWYQPTYKTLFQVKTSSKGYLKQIREILAQKNVCYAHGMPSNGEDMKGSFIQNFCLSISKLHEESSYLKETHSFSWNLA